MLWDNILPVGLIHVLNVNFNNSLVGSLILGSEVELGADIVQVCKLDCFVETGKFNWFI